MMIFFLAGEELQIEYQVDLDAGKEVKRLHYGDPHKNKNSFTMTHDKTCNDKVYLEHRVSSCNHLFSLDFEVLTTIARVYF